MVSGGKGYGEGDELREGGGGVVSGEEGEEGEALVTARFCARCLHVGFLCLLPPPPQINKYIRNY